MAGKYPREQISAVNNHFFGSTNLVVNNPNPTTAPQDKSPRLNSPNTCPIYVQSTLYGKRIACEAVELGSNPSLETIS